MHRTVQASLLFLTISAPILRAQTSARSDQVVQRVEVGIQFTNLFFQPCLLPANCAPAPPSQFIGPALTLNLTNHLAIDALLSATPANDNNPIAYLDGSVAGGHGFNVLAGPRAEVRGGRFGVFVAARVGLLRWSNIITNQQRFYNSPTDPPVLVLNTYSPGNYFAGETVVGTEYALSRRTHLRLEVGDQLIDYRQASNEGATSSTPVPAAWDSNAILRGSISYGIGKPVGSPMHSLQTTVPHHFFGSTNLTLLGISMAAQASDDVTTQRFLHHGIQEADGIARPFVDQGWAGQIGLAVIVNSAQLGVMYTLHKIGCHRIERALPVASAVASAYSAYHTQREY